MREVLVDDEDKQATVIVPDDQLSLAIGRDGQNARLAARLTGWRVDIKSESEFAQEEDEITYEGEEEFDGRCMALLSNGRRCPNAAVGGTTYCGLPTHQALSRFQTSQVAILNDLSEEQIATLADPEADEAAVAAIVGPAEAAFGDEASAEGSDALAAGAEASAAGPESAGDPAAPGSEAEDVAGGDSSQAAGEEPTSTPSAEGESEPEAEAAEPQPAGTPDAPGREAEEASGGDSEEPSDSGFDGDSPVAESQVEAEK